MSEMRTRVPETSGIPLGGIGAGSVELLPDGGFHDWEEMFQLGGKPEAWPTNTSDTFCTTPNPDMSPDALAFVLRTQTDGEGPVVRMLSMNPHAAQTLYSLSWLKSVEEIAFEQKFPAAHLRYVDEALPVDVSSEFLSPFVPHDSRTSGTPGFYATYKLTNTSGRSVKVSLLARLKNPVHWGLRNRGLENHVAVEGDTAYLDMTTSAFDERRPTTGSMTLAASGGSLSWVSGEYGPYMGQGAGVSSPFYASWHQGLYRDFRDGVAGESPGLCRAPTDWCEISDADVDAMDVPQAKAFVDELCAMPYAADVRRRVMGATPEVMESIGGIRDFIKSVLALLSVHGGDNSESWGDGALIVSVDLEPGEVREIRFTLAWHFPFHYAANETLLGHMYENWYSDSAEVCRFMVSKQGEIVPVARRFSDTLCETTLPAVFPDAWSGQLGTLVKSSWWIKNGRFGIWEGLRCCGFHTMDISYQGSFSLLALFPDLEKVQMELSSMYQRADGRIPHILAIDFNQVDDDFERVDMNPQFVLLTCRDWMWTGDRAYLDRQWPAVVLAIDNMLLLDGDGDGLPDHDTRKNTYDNWNFYGTPSYIASLWLSSLTAAAKMAGDMGDGTHAAQWNAQREKCAASFDRKLWNGEYYNLWIDGETRDECCMADQIDGEWFTKIVGLAPGLSEDRILAVCDAVMKHNYSDEGGLRNASYPVDFAGRRVFHTFNNSQADANWTGIEYLFAALLYACGRTENSHKIVANVDERHARAGRRWNHLECGDHYYRAMSSWTLMLAASGFVPDVPNNRLTVVPVEGEVRAPWVSSTGWGRMEWEDGRLGLICEGGSISFGELCVKSPTASARVNGGVVRAAISRTDQVTTLKFDGTITLASGDTLLTE